MNRLIAAIDAMGGVADESGIPWQGRVPSDAQYFVNQTRTGILLMGYRTYEEMGGPLGTGENFVGVREGPTPSLRAGFTPTADLESFFADHADLLVWVIGGAGLFGQAMPFADELYLTRLQEDFRCTKFFPDFADAFHLVDRAPTLTENDIAFAFEIWQRK